MEKWLDIKGFKGKYKVSDSGRVKSLPRRGRREEKILRPYSCPKGYLIVDLRKLGNKNARKVHRIVMENFVRKSKLHVNHINGIKSDNRLENLEYCKNYENQNHKMLVVNKNKMYGVYFDKTRNKWVAQLKFSSVRVFVKRFETKKEAYEAFRLEYKKYRGVFPW